MRSKTEDLIIRERKVEISDEEANDINQRFAEILKKLLFENEYRKNVDDKL